MHWTTHVIYIIHNRHGHAVQAPACATMYLPLSRRVFPSIWTLVLDEAESVGLIINNKVCKHVSEGDKEASTSNQGLVVLQFQYTSRRQQKLNFVRHNLSRLMQNGDNSCKHILYNRSYIKHLLQLM